jgi:hypothetical protein
MSIEDCRIEGLTIDQSQNDERWLTNDKWTINPLRFGERQSVNPTIRQSVNRQSSMRQSSFAIRQSSIESLPEILD